MNLMDDDALRRTPDLPMVSCGTDVQSLAGRGLASFSASGV